MNSDIQHIAIIPDGNRTRASNQWLASHLGHEEWYLRTKEILEYAFDHFSSLQWISFWAMSTENMKKRSPKEQKLLFSLLERWLEELKPILEKHKINFMWLGDRETISKNLLEKLDALQKYCTYTTTKTLNLLFNYGGKRHITHAAKKCLELGKECMDQYMSFGDLPPVDLIIRTKWVKRSSGFLPWESYAERYFTDLMYPDFDTHQLDLAIQDWTSRQRNFGA